MKKDRQGVRMNRAGRALAGDRAAALMEAAEETVPSSAGDASGLATVRELYAEQSEPMGSPPALVSPGGKRSAQAQTVLLLDKLGERLAFERSGVRLYDGLVSKAAGGTWPGGPAMDDLEHIREEERGHARLVEELIVELGGDPSAVTPSANLHAVASKGLCSVIADPRTTLRECLEAILVAELVDNDAWPLLIELSRGAGQDGFAERMEQALQNEREHLEKVRTWLAEALVGAAIPPEKQAPPARPQRAAAKRATRRNTRNTRTTAKKTSRPSTRTARPAPSRARAAKTSKRIARKR